MFEMMNKILKHCVAQLRSFPILSDICTRNTNLQTQVCNLQQTNTTHPMQWHFISGHTL